MVLDRYLDQARVAFSSAWVHTQEILLWDTTCMICLLDRKCRIHTRRDMLDMDLHSIPQDTLLKAPWIGYLHSNHSNINVKDPTRTQVIMDTYLDHRICLQWSLRFRMPFKVLLQGPITDRLPSTNKLKDTGKSKDIVSTLVIANLCRNLRKLIQQDWRLLEEVMENIGTKSRNLLWHTDLHNMRKDTPILNTLNRNHNMHSTSMAITHPASTHKVKGNLWI